MSFVICKELLPFGFSKIRQLQYKRISSCAFQYCGGFSPLLFIGILQGIAAGIGIYQFPRPFFINVLEFLILRINEIMSSFGISIAHLCFALRIAASIICLHISGHTLSGLEIVCFLVSFLPDHENPLSFNTMNLVKPVHASDNSRSSSTFE